MYLIKALTTAKGPVDHNGIEKQWTAGDKRWIEDEHITHYLNHPTAFEVVISGAVDQRHTLGTVASSYIDFNDVGEAGMAIEISGVVYQEADAAVPANGVWTNGASAEASATSLTAALNGDTRATVPFTAVRSGDGVWLFWDTPGDTGGADVTTDSAANCTVQHGFNGGSDPKVQNVVRFTAEVTAQLLLSGAIEIPLPFTPAGHHVTALSATGAPVYFTDLITIATAPVRMKITTTGAVNLADTDVVHVTIWD